MKKKTVVVVMLSAAIVVSAIIFWQNVGRNWWEIKQYKISVGLSEPNFPWRDRNQDELNKLYPQVQNADVPARTTPEQTYAKFRDGLKDNDLSLVLDQLCVESEQYDTNAAAVTKAYNEGRFAEIYEKYPEVITQAWMGDTISDYNFKEIDSEYSHGIQFIKNDQGDWKINKY